MFPDWIYNIIAELETLDLDFVRLVAYKAMLPNLS